MKKSRLLVAYSDKLGIALCLIGLLLPWEEQYWPEAVMGMLGWGQHPAFTLFLEQLAIIGVALVLIDLHVSKSKMGDMRFLTLVGGAIVTVSSSVFILFSVVSPSPIPSYRIAGLPYRTLYGAYLDMMGGLIIISVELIKSWKKGLRGTVSLKRNILQSLVDNLGNLGIILCVISLVMPWGGFSPSVPMGLPQYAGFQLIPGLVAIASLIIMGVGFRASKTRNRKRFVMLTCGIVISLSLLIWLVFPDVFPDRIYFSSIGNFVVLHGAYLDLMGGLIVIAAANNLEKEKINAQAGTGQETASAVR